MDCTQKMKILIGKAYGQSLVKFIYNILPQVISD